MTDPRTEPLTDAQLENLELAARAIFGEDERSQAMINGVLSLITEVRRLRQSFGGDAQAADLAALVDEVRRLQSLLETEQRAKWTAKQDKQHWQEEAERLRAELRGLVERRIDDQWGCPLCPDAGDYDSGGDFWHEDDCVYDQLIPKLELSE